MTRGTAELMMALLAAGAVAACQERPPPRPPPLPTVGVITVQLRTLPQTYEWVASLDGSTTAEIRPQVSGYIREVNYQEGSHVAVGQLMFTIDDRPFLAAVKQAQGQHENAIAELNKAKADVTRYTPLVADHAISREQLENARAAVLANEATVQATKGVLETAELNLKWARVRSPIVGLAGIARVRVGTLVDPNQVLTVVSTTDPMRASFNVRQQDYLRYAENINNPDAAGQTGPPTFELILIDGRTYPHVVHNFVVNREIDPTTGTLQVQALFPNPEGLLRPGLFAKVRLRTGSNQEMPTVPEQAVSQLQGRYQVAVVDAQQQVQVRRIEVAFQAGHFYAVQSGLRPGEQVVVEGQQNALPGTKVNAVESHLPPPALDASVEGGSAPDGGETEGDASDGGAPPPPGR